MSLTVTLLRALLRALYGHDSDTVTGSSAVKEAPMGSICSLSSAGFAGWV